MDNYFETGVQYFENGKYEEALLCFIAAYESGEDHELVLNSIYDCYVCPNEEEFRDSYMNNKDVSCNLEYDELLIDFIPVSDERFYMFHKGEKRFLGCLNLPQIIQREKASILSVLITEEWDFREYQNILFQNNWGVTYFVVGKEAPLFYSFFKIPHFVEKYLKYALFFKDVRHMEEFFSSHEEFYLPHLIGGKNTGGYKDVITKIHEFRLANGGKERENVFLSICIPSYNRGKLALKLVKELLQEPYDLEIEIVVSDNGSEKECEYYKQISEINDVRVRYHRFDKNRGFAENFHMLMRMAKGIFSIFMSDEDHFVPSVLLQVLDVLSKNEKVGVAYLLDTEFFRINDWWYEKAGIKAAFMGKEQRYMSGIIINNKALQSIDGEKWIMNHRENSAYKWYTHTVYALYLGYYTDAMRLKFPGVVKGQTGATAEENLSEGFEMEKSKDDDTHILRYMWPESRIEQMQAYLKLERELFQDDEIFEQGNAFCNEIENAFKLSALAYQKNPKEFVEKYSWEEACERIKDAAIACFPKEDVLHDVLKRLTIESYEKWRN